MTKTIFIILFITSYVHSAYFLKLNSGWNLIGTGLESIDMGESFQYSSNSDLLFLIYENKKWKSYDINKSKYEFKSLGKFQGYWLYSPNEKTLKVNLLELTSPIVEIKKGWNLLGSGKFSKDVELNFDEDSEGEIWIYKDNWSLNPKYIESYSGFWLKASRDYWWEVEDNNTTFDMDKFTINIYENSRDNLIKLDLNSSLKINFLEKNSSAKGTFEISNEKKGYILYTPISEYLNPFNFFVYIGESEKLYKKEININFTTAKEDNFYPREIKEKQIIKNELKKIDNNGSAIAILKFDEYEAMAIARTLEPVAINYKIVENIEEIFNYEIVIVAGSIDSSISSEVIEELSEYVKDGKVLILSNINNKKAYSLAGLINDAYYTDRKSITFIDSDDPIMSYINEKSEKYIDIFGDNVAYASRGYVCKEEIIAYFDDSSGAICKNNFEKGIVYSFGIKFSDFTVKRQGGERFDVSKKWTNKFNPIADIPILLLRGIYEKFTSNPITRELTKDGYKGTLILTHDVDSASAFSFILDYFEMENRLDINSTFFIQTSAYKTGYVSAFYTRLNRDLIAKYGNRHDYGSHTFSHFINLHKCEVGDSTINSINYFPKYDSTTPECSLYGELGVSKSLIEEDLNYSVEAYRSGHLAEHANLYDTLYELGYKRSSNIASGKSGTYFPFLAISDGVEKKIVEYPLSISDAEYDETNMDSLSLSNKWYEVLEQNSKNKTPTLLLVHPTPKIGKIEMVEKFLTKVKKDGYWIVDFKTFSEFWESQGVLGEREFLDIN